MSTILSFISQKGGVGKTTSAVNIATAFAIGGYHVLLIDLDPQSSISYSMGIRKKVNQGTKELFLEPSIPVHTIIEKTKEHPNLDFIFSNIQKLSSERSVLEVCNEPSFLLNRLKEETSHYDFIIIDSPASTNNIAVNAIYASHLIILPLQCENLAIKSFKRFLISFQELQNMVKEKPLKLAGILLTMYNFSSEVHQKICKQMYKALSDSIFKTIIPVDPSIIEASALGKSVITYDSSSISSTAYIRFMNEIVDKFSLR